LQDLQSVLKAGLRRRAQSFAFLNDLFDSHTHPVVSATFPYTQQVVAGESVVLSTLIVLVTIQSVLPDLFEPENTVIKIHVVILYAAFHASSRRPRAHEQRSVKI